MKKTTIIALMAFLLQALFIGQAFGKTKDEELAEKVMAGIMKIGTGPEAKVEVKLKDKTKLKGYVVESNNEQFVVMDAKSGQAVPVAYPTVKQVKGNNLSTGAKIAIAVGVFIVAIILFGTLLKT